MFFSIMQKLPVPRNRSELVSLLYIFNFKVIQWFSHTLGGANKWTLKGKFTLVVHRLSYNEIMNVVYNIIFLSFEGKSTLVVSELCGKNHNPTVMYTAFVFLWVVALVAVTIRHLYQGWLLCAQS